MKEMWAIYDEHDECIAVDVKADNATEALAQFTYVNNRWRAVIQDAATYSSDMRSR